jgi:16S rRNA processing protein RimM
MAADTAFEEKRSGRLCVGEITTAHGLNGEVCVRSFTADPQAVAAYGPVLTDSGNGVLDLRVVGRKKAALIVAVRGVTDRTSAEALRGARLYVERAALPATDEDEYYHVDLIGLDVALDAGKVAGEGAPPGTWGQVAAVHDYGAGPMLEIKRPATASVLVPFTREAVPMVDVAAGRLVIAPLPGLIAPADDAEANEPGAITPGTAAVTHG